MDYQNLFTQSLMNISPVSRVTGAISSLFNKKPAPISQITPSSVGATPSTPAPIAKPAVSTPKQQYTQSLIGTPQNSTSPVNSTQNPANPNANLQGAGVFSKPDPTRAAFDQYLASLQPDENLTRATKSLADFDLQSMKDQEKALDSGETLGFAAGEAQRVNRNNQFERIARANTVDSLKGVFDSKSNAAKARLDFEKFLTENEQKGGSGDAFTLSPGESRYDASGNLIASGGPKPLSQAQETANLAKTEKEEVAQQQASQTIGLVNGLLGGNYKGITGAGQSPLNLVGGIGKDATAINQYNQLQGLLKLGIRGMLKGQGAVSDYEGRLLGQAASALGRNLGNEEFAQALKTIRGVLQTNNGLETQVTVKDKNGNIIGQGLLNGNDIYEAVNDGNIVEYQ